MSLKQTIKNNIVDPYDRQRLDLVTGQVMSYDEETNTATVSYRDSKSGGTITRDGVPIELPGLGVIPSGPFPGDQVYLAFGNGNQLRPKVIAKADESYANYTRPLTKHSRKGAYLTDYLGEVATFVGGLFESDEEPVYDDWIDNSESVNYNSYQNYSTDEFTSKGENWSYYRSSEVGFTHPLNSSTVKIRDNGVIESFASTNCGWRIDPNGHSQNFISSKELHNSTNTTFLVDRKMGLEIGRQFYLKTPAVLINADKQDIYSDTINLRADLVESRIDLYKLIAKKVEAIIDELELKADSTKIDSEYLEIKSKKLEVKSEDYVVDAKWGLIGFESVAFKTRWGTVNAENITSEIGHTITTSKMTELKTDYYKGDINQVELKVDTVKAGFGEFVLNSGGATLNLNKSELKGGYHKVSIGSLEYNTTAVNGKIGTIKLTNDTTTFNPSHYRQTSETSVQTIKNQEINSETMNANITHATMRSQIINLSASDTFVLNGNFVTVNGHFTADIDHLIEAWMNKNLTGYVERVIAQKQFVRLKSK